MEKRIKVLKIVGKPSRVKVLNTAQIHTKSESKKGTIVPKIAFWLGVLALACAIATFGKLGLKGFVPPVMFWLAAVVAKYLNV